MKQLVKKIVSLLLVLALALPLCPLTHAKAETLTEEEINNHQIVKNRYPTVVSLGDSYSSGEGGEDYYGMEKPIETRITDQDWLGHRSASSWPGQLEFENEQGERVALKEYRYNPYNNKPLPAYNEPKWFFTAVSGAVTAEFFRSQKKKYNLKKEYKELQEKEQQKQYQDVVSIPNAVQVVSKQPKVVAEDVPLDPQRNIFQHADHVDYVTITIGGNDVGFTDVIMQCVFSNTDFSSMVRDLNRDSLLMLMGNPALMHLVTADMLLKSNGLDKMFADVMKNINAYGLDIKAVYRSIHEEAPNAAIIVAGYPKLLYSEGGVVNWQADGLLDFVNDAATQTIFSKYEAEIINEKVEWFNNKLRLWVTEVRLVDDIPIYFVDVASKFGDHGAYAPGECVNGILLGARPGELKQNALFSDGSFHPNEEGRSIYRDAVQECIEYEVELKQIRGQVRIVNNDMSVSAVSAGYTVELTRDSDPSFRLTMKTGSHGTFTSDAKAVGVHRGTKAGEYSLHVFDPNGRECGLLGKDGNATVKLMYHTSGDLDILISPSKQEVSGTVNVRTAKNKAVEVDFSDDPLILCFTDKTGNRTVCPAEDQTPITKVGGKGVKYSVLLFPGEYTVEAFGKNSGMQYLFLVGGGEGKESVKVSVLIGKDVKNSDLTLLGNSQTYVGTWVDEISLNSPFGISSTMRLTLELGKMMDASLTSEESTDVSMYGWSESGLPNSTSQAETFQGTWQELENGIVFYVNGDPAGPIYFDLVKRNTLQLNLTKLESLASSSSEEGLMMVAMLESLKYLMSADIGSLFGMSLGTSMNDMLGVDSTDDLFCFTKK